MTSARFFVGRTTVLVFLVAAVSLLAPPLYLSILDIATPRFSPAQFNLPSSAREVVSRRTETMVTFEIEPGKFAQVSGIERGIEPACQTKLCSLLSPLHDLLPNVFATSAGPNNPGTMADDATVGTVAWSDPNNAQTSNDAYAVASLPEGAFSHYLKATNFNFSIPTGATIDGIVVDAEKSGDTGEEYDYRARIVKGGAIGLTDKSDGQGWDLLVGYVSYGNSLDKWGETWMPSDINAANFGYAISCQNYGMGATCYVDHIRITVYYTEAATPVPFFSWWSVPLLIVGLFLILRKEGMLSHHLIFAWGK